jgi:hypothetical protein
MIKLQEIDFPIDCEINTHDFYDYEPELSFTAANSLQYLSEDLLSCAFPADHLVIDLGWYGDITKNEGEFKIQIIQSQNWDNPVNVIFSKSADEIKTLLNKILQYYTSSIVEEEDDI